MTLKQILLLHTCHMMWEVSLPQRLQSQIDEWLFFFVLHNADALSMNINMFFLYLAVDSLRLECFSYWGSGRRYCECQARTRGGKVVLPSVNLSFVHLIRYLHYASFCNACPQLLNDVNYKLSGNNGLGIVDVKEECSSYSSNYSINEGNPSLQLYVVLYCFSQIAFMLL